MVPIFEKFVTFLEEPCLFHNGQESIFNWCYRPWQLNLLQTTDSDFRLDFFTSVFLAFHW